MALDLESIWQCSKERPKERLRGDLIVCYTERLSEELGRDNNVVCEEQASKAEYCSLRVYVEVRGKSPLSRGFQKFREPDTGLGCFVLVSK